jgi:hypothetical protein
MSGQFHALAALPEGKKPLLPIREDVSWGP